MYFVILALSAFFFAAAGTAIALFLLRRTEFFALPNERSNHRVPTPTGGGIAMVFSIVSFLMVSGAPGNMLWAVVLLAVISFLDDRYDMLPSWRFGFQILAVALAVSEMQGQVFQGLLPPLLDKIATGFIWLWMINLTNFMDGIDGITGMETIAIVLGLCLLGIAVPDYADTYLPREAGIIAAACAGFLIFNWHPAKLFMGDVGSIPLGLLLGSLLLRTAEAGWWIPALILPAYYLADATLTLLGRLHRREKIWEAHSQHAYQKAVRFGRAHDAVVKDIARFNGLLILLAMVSVIGTKLSLSCGAPWQCVAGKYLPLACLAAAYGSALLFLRWLERPPVMKAHAA